MTDHHLSRLAAMLCGEPEFRAWLKAGHPRWYAAAEDTGEFDPAIIAAAVLRRVCEVGSRAELDTDTEAASRFHARIRLPWVETQESEIAAENRGEMA